MLTRRQVIEQHLKKAQESLQQRTSVLKERKLEGKKQVRKDVTYREVEAVIRKYNRRLKALDKTDAVNADLETRRAERAAAPKEPKVKKKKVVEVKPAKGGAKKEKKAAAQ